MRQYQSCNPLGIRTLQPYSDPNQVIETVWRDGVATPVPHDALGFMVRIFVEASSATASDKFG